MGRLNRKIARFFGYDLMRYKKSFRFEATLDRLLANHSFDCVMDVGANEGWFSKYTMGRINNVPIFSFEPAPDIAGRLTAAAAGNPRWHIVETALSDMVGSATLNVGAGSGVYSSLNAAKPEFAASMTGLQFVDSAPVSLTTLDIFLADNDLKKFNNILLKIDTQGHDMKVLRGASETLKQAAAVIVELPFQSIYETEDSHCDIMALMDDSGFDIYSLSPISCDETGRLIEADCFYTRHKNRS